MISRNLRIRCCVYLALALIAGSWLVAVVTLKQPHLWPLGVSPYLLAAVFLGSLLAFRLQWICPCCNEHLPTLAARHCSRCSSPIFISNESPPPDEAARAPEAIFEFGALLGAEEYARYRAGRIFRRAVLISAALFGALYLSTHGSFTDAAAWMLLLAVSLICGKAAAYLSYLWFIATAWKCPSCRKALPSPYRIEPAEINSCSSCGASFCATQTREGWSLAFP